MQPTVKADLRDIWQAETRAAAAAAMDTFAKKYGAKYEKAVTCLTKDRQALLTFYDFPADHWDHLRTGNPIESVFATVRHRTVRTKGALSQKTAKLMVFKLVQAAGKTWRRLKGANQLPLQTTPQTAPLDQVTSPKIAYSSQPIRRNPRMQYAAGEAPGPANSHRDHGG
jgi:transposase-like protein